MKVGPARESGMWFSAVLLLAVALRLYNLGEWDMWTDEVQTLWTSQSGQFREGPMYRTAPLNFLLTGFAVGLLGPNELGSRLVPFLAGVLTVALFFPIMRRWIGGRAALFGMLVVALSMWHVYWSQTARHFALQTLLILGAVYAFLSYWREGRRAGLAGAAGLLLAALFVHSSSGFFVAGFLVFVTADWILPSGKGFTGPQAGRVRKHVLALVVLCAPLVVYLPVYFGLGSYLLEHKTAWNPPWNIVGSLGFYMPPYIALPALAGAAFLYRERDDLWLLLSCLIVVPAVLVTVASAVTIASAAYCLALVLAVGALVGVAADRIFRLGEQYRASLGAGLVVGAVFLSQVYDLAHYYLVYNGLKPRWREVATYVQERRGSRDLFFAAEGDVAQFYVGRENAAWLGAYDKLRESSSFPPSGVEGLWYAVYVPDNSVLERHRTVFESVADRAEMKALFPLQYGAKRRSVAVFYEPLGGADAP